MDKNHRQVGGVIAGYKIPRVMETILSLKSEIMTASGLTLIISAWGAFVLARHIKRQMFQLEPHEIARLVVERTEAFNAMYEGVIDIDNEEHITIFNDKAKEMLGIKGDVAGRKIQEVLPDMYLSDILKYDSSIYNQNLTIRNQAIVSSHVSIHVNGQKAGAIAIFQDRTQVKRLAEELTDVKAFVSALRVQKHEHMNKLHTIAGLIQLGNREKALQYVFKATEGQEELTRFLSKNIKYDSLSGLLLSKVSRGKELGIHVTIDRHSQLSHLPPLLNYHDLVIVLRNLIENAYDSFDEQNEDNEIYVSIHQTKQVLSIRIKSGDLNKDPHFFNTNTKADFC